MRFLIVCNKCGHAHGWHPTEPPYKQCEKCGSTDLRDEGTA